MPKLLLDTRKSSLLQGTGVTLEMITDGLEAGSMRIAIFHRRQGGLFVVYDTLKPYHVQQLANEICEKG